MGDFHCSQPGAAGTEKQHNIQHRTSNIQLPMRRSYRAVFDAQRWMLDVDRPISRRPKIVGKMSDFRLCENRKCLTNSVPRRDELCKNQAPKTKTKHQKPSSKNQRNPKRQIPILPATSLPWSLVFGIWIPYPLVVTEGTVGWATFGCGTGSFGVRGQAKRDPALARSARSAGTVKAPSPLRFAGALQRSRVSPILRTPL